METHWYYLYTASDPDAFLLLEELQKKGFIVYDKALANAAGLLVLADKKPDKARLIKAIKTLRAKGLIESFVKIGEVGPTETVVDIKNPNNPSWQAIKRSNK